ncbi:MAG: hypothetical protein ACWGSQ_05065 [Longimicrobiales bacterium]
MPTAGVGDRASLGFGSWLASLPSRWGLVSVCVASVLVTLVTIRPRADPDLFARVAVGRLIEVNGRVTDRDPFPFTPLLDRWIDHEWLSGVVFYQVARLGGDWALLAFDLLLMIAMVFLVIRAQEERSGASLGWSLVTLALVFGPWTSVVRSRAFTLLSVAVLLLVLVRWRNGRSGWIWVLPPIFLLWANAHGGFVAGLGLLGAATAAVMVRTPRESGALWACLGACVAVTLINPYGLDYWGYILRAVTHDRGLVLEWQRMQGWQVGMVSLLGAVYLWGAWLRRREGRVSAESVGLLAVSLVAALESQRLLNFLLLVVAVYGAAEYRAVIGALGRGLSVEYRLAASHLSGAATLAILAIMGVLIGINLKTFASSGLDYSRYPVDGVEWLHRHGAGGRLLAHFNHGSYAIWRLYPLYRVAVDGRYEETYPEETVQLAWAALYPNVPGHEDALRRIDPDYILLPGPDWARHFGDRWVLVHSDSVSAVLARPGLDAVENRPPRGMWVPGF